MSSAPPALSRALLTPGPLPPHSHLGVTLLRHAVATGLRYAFYHLGLPVPEAPPVRIARLRLYLELGKLEKVLRGVPGGMEVAAALLDPGGAGTLPAGAGRIAAAAAFHRARLRLRRHRAARLPPVRGTGGEKAPWARFQVELSRSLPRTNQALLAELLAALGRRARRARGEDVPPVPSRAAAAFLAGVPARRRGQSGARAWRTSLEKFGLPDPLAPSWATTPELAERVRSELGPSKRPASPAGSDLLRGTFRETWREALTRLSPLLAAHAAAAVARGYLERQEDAFFVALDLQEDLARAVRPRWIETAVYDNRAEREALLATPEPAELLRTGLETMDGGGPAAWDRTPLLPLP